MRHFFAMLRRLFYVCVIAALVGSACNPSPNQKIFHVRGVVMELFPDSKTIKIKHEEIPGYMPAMTMPFEVRDAKELLGLKPGDAVEFRMIVTDKEGWIDQIKKTDGPSMLAAPANGNLPSRSTIRVARDVEPLNVGDTVPNYTFTNELGQAVSLDQFKGRAIAITFIFTRCPFPDFCPRMSNNFKEAYDKLRAMPNGPRNWHLLTLSFDPEFDSPAVLRGYAQRYSADPAYWNFLTGSLVEIDAIAEQFGLVFPRSADGGFDHNMRTAVIDTRGKVQSILVGNKWTSDELVGEISKAAKARPPPS
jgi:protein SCO1/2